MVPHLGFSYCAAMSEDNTLPPRRRTLEAADGELWAYEMVLDSVLKTLSDNDAEIAIAWCENVAGFLGAVPSENEGADFSHGFAYRAKRIALSLRYRENIRDRGSEPSSDQSISFCLRCEVYWRDHSVPCPSCGTFDWYTIQRI